MPDTVLIDGHNALYALGLAGGSDHEADRNELLFRVAERWPHALVYFDGRNGPSGLPRVFRQKGVKVHYCKDEEADHEIVEDVRDATHPRRLTVVTNDRELAGRCGQLGARVLSVVAALGPPRGRRPLPPERSPNQTPRRRRPRVQRSLPGERVASDVPPVPSDADRPLTPADFGLPDEIDPDDPRWR